ncbi:MAG: phenylalanine--tRNA ligase subunit alpha [Hyphomicrobiaceae bacterium]|nr:phenylalanine--tRNA ligase subunit alpha [Hyphomicrobiaceae bacterium]
MSGADDLVRLEQRLVGEIGAAPDLAALDAVRVAALGKKGAVAALLSELGKMAPEDRKAYGAAVNAVKDRVAAALDDRKSALEAAALEARLAAETADITLPVRTGPVAEGRIHPVSQVTDELVEIFASLGFSVAEGPDIESDDYNFTKLNMPAEHPARQAHDTFYFPPSVDGGQLVLRTHTSPVQIRTMLAGKPPIRIIAPGRVYRCDSDQTHTPMFHQIEALVIDEATHMGHLKWVLEEMCKAFFEVDEVKMRLRASHFPFTEPSAEIDIDKAALGKPGEWLEIGGCGMVHPNVLRNCGIDPERYQGFAFGMGIDRMAMLKYGIPDLRAFFSGDMRWLRHYGFSLIDQPTLAGGLSR